MTTMKDKLSASVRQARSQQPVEGAAASDTSAATAAPVKAKPAPVAKPKPAPKPKTAAKPDSLPVKRASDIDVQPSGNALFPSRVWPD
jgi:hypothetical protein